MSQFLGALVDHYPDMMRAVEAIDRLVREAEAEGTADVVVLYTRTDDEAERVNAAIRGAAEDGWDAVGSFVQAGAEPAGAEGAELRVRLMVLALRACQLGVWLGQSRLASIRPEDVQRRLAQHLRARAQRAP